MGGEGMGEGGGGMGAVMVQTLCNSDTLLFSDPLAPSSSTSHPLAEPRQSAQRTAREAGQPSSRWRHTGTEGRLHVTSH